VQKVVIGRELMKAAQAGLQRNAAE
jgi:hypothetical protein